MSLSDDFDNMDQFDKTQLLHSVMTQEKELRMHPRKNSMFKTSAIFASATIFWSLYYKIYSALDKDTRRSLSKVEDTVNNILNFAPTNLDSDYNIFSKGKGLARKFQEAELGSDLNSWHAVQNYANHELGTRCEQISNPSIVYDTLNELMPFASQVIKKSLPDSVEKGSGVMKYSPDQIYDVTFKAKNGEDTRVILPGFVSDFSGKVFFSNPCFCNGGFTPTKLLHLYYNIYGDKLMISKYVTKTDAKIKVAKLDQSISADYYIPEQDKKERLLRQIVKFKDQFSAQRSYLLYGPPGSGKSSFAIEFATCSKEGKVVKIDSSFFEDVSFADIKTTLENFECDVLILDDIDRVQNGSQSFLYILESLKQLKHKPIFFATTNDIRKLDAAALRPGRLDEIIEFRLPDSEEMLKFVTTMLGKYELHSYTQEEKLAFSEALIGFTKAYAKEYCEQLKIGESIDDVIVSIRQRKELMKQVWGSSED